jgi:hypothetical protein
MKKYYLVLVFDANNEVFLSLEKADPAGPPPPQAAPAGRRSAPPVRPDPVSGVAVRYARPKI